MRAAQGRGELSVRELARLVGRDVKRVHADVTVLATLGMLERTEQGGLICPFASMHIDMYLETAQGCIDHRYPANDDVIAVATINDVIART